MKVLVACEYSGTVREALLAEGHDADILLTYCPRNRSQRPALRATCAELREPWDLVMAHPPWHITLNEPEAGDIQPFELERQEAAMDSSLGML